VVKFNATAGAGRRRCERLALDGPKLDKHALKFVNLASQHEHDFF
jgi:hypothetical protein